MFSKVKLTGACVALACIAAGAMTESASAAPTAVAKKCEALAAKAYPPRVPGNPAAGLAKGTPQEERAYFNKCVANKGKMTPPR